MNKKIRAISLMLVACMLFSVAGCKIRIHSKETTETTTTTEATTTEATTEATTTAESSAATEPSETTSSESSGFPEKGCKIEFPSGDRYLYKMYLTLDDKKNTIGGHVDATFFNDSSDDWDKLCLRDYSSLFLKPEDAGYDGGVKTNGALTEINNIQDSRTGNTIEYERDKDVSVVWLPLEKKLAPGEKMTLSYDFVAQIPTVADRYGVQDGVFCITNFYPILAEYTSEGWSHIGFYACGECFYSEIADFDVMLTVPSDMVVLSTGVETSEAKEGDTKTIGIYAECVRDFVFCGSKNFKLVEGDYKDTHVRTAYFEEEKPEYDKMEAEIALKAAIDSLEAFGSAFGEYPYKDLEVIIAPISAGGMEYPNLVIISKAFVGTGDSDESRKEIYQLSADNVVSHEVGHQWFMGIVGSNSGLQPWLDESFASFTEYIYELAVYPDKAHQLPVTFDDGYYTRNVPINKSYFDYDDNMSYISSVYWRGKQILVNMYELLGEEQFNGIIREYVHEFAFKNADQMDFFNLLYKYAGTDNEKLNDIIYENFDDTVQPPKAA
ncbi:MAG: M1 family metallopeptidase [Clostridiales bacterium]|nr:M1 family metallopeptidase [Clostridiales bacterium]